MDRYEDQESNPGCLAGISSGFKAIDDMTSGMRAGDLIVLASQSLEHASTLALNIAEHVALRECHPAAVFSMRMSGRELARRMLGSLGRVDLHGTRAGAWTEDERARLAAAYAELQTGGLHVHSGIGLTPTSLRTKVLKLALALKPTRLGLLVIDALELIRPSMVNGGEAALLAGITLRSLKLVAKEFQLAVMVLTQIPCIVDADDSRQPGLNGHPLAEVIGEVADVVMILHPAACSDPTQSCDAGKVTLGFNKLSDGIAGEVQLRFDRDPLRFKNLPGI
ncbi:MAG: DnaB-like helicase C-terminal domain-containing protein [Polaromonas sp.]|uniref:DnaB-like helicase C-terminal domain-containing protein n=1 Tax=Polaromonas sp. TaxID=1869339 RepID=UPI002732394A|nr:DnaB-like helicase C-terminal domain-containing protein [Polaromonas sp.]MDP2819638.1 DnaB-like helicase C-terminal domain-containing protein [Polaromonas sp.]